MAISAFTVGGYVVLTFARPTPSSAAQAYFAVSLPDYTPPQERLARITFPGVNGQTVKKLGSTPATLSQVGWVEGSTFSNLQTARALLEQYAIDQTAGSLSILDGTKSFSTAIITGLKWGRQWGHSGRYCADYEIVWETVG